MTDGNTQVREALDRSMKSGVLYLNLKDDRDVATIHLLREISDQLHMIQESLHRIALNTNYTP